ncbi:MAG: nickel ABC transporter permease [Dehalococcoidia bacterium]
MSRYLVQRLLAVIPVLFGVATATFIIVHILPGDPVRAMLGQEEVNPAQIERLRRELGLNDPLHVQYVKFLGGAVRGDLGRSLLSNRPVFDEILGQFPSTIQLAAFSLTFAMIFGLTMGMIAAVKHHTWVDTLAMLVAIGGVATPNFFLGLLLIYIFSVQLNWLPATGSGGFKALILPGITLGMALAAILARLVRSSMLEVLRLDYITTARAKGLRERIVVGRHALRNALIPVVTTLGVQVGALLGGAIVIETVFARQGLGRLIIQAVLQKDAPLIQATVLFTAAVYVVVNLVVDLSYGFLDPRTRID